MTNPTSDGWVTFHETRLPNGRTVLTQKRDGCTRSVIR